MGDSGERVQPPLSIMTLEYLPIIISIRYIEGKLYSGCVALAGEVYSFREPIHTFGFS